MASPMGRVEPVEVMESGGGHERTGMDSSKNYCDAAKTGLNTKRFRDSDQFPLFQQEESDKFKLLVAINTERNILSKESLKMETPPWRVVCAEGKANTWVLCFKPAEVEKVRVLKNLGPNLKIGSLTTRNMHYSPGQSSKEVDKPKIMYSLDLQYVNPIPGEKDVARMLEEKKVEGVGLIVDVLDNLETGFFTVCATSDHKDGAVVLDFGKHKVPLRRDNEKIQRRHAARRDLEQKQAQVNQSGAQQDNPKRNQDQGWKSQSSKKSTWKRPPFQRQKYLPKVTPSIPVSNTFEPLVAKEEPPAVPAVSQSSTLENGKEEVVEMEVPDQASISNQSKVKTTSTQPHEATSASESVNLNLDKAASPPTNASSDSDKANSTDSNKEVITISVKDTVYGQIEQVSSNKTKLVLLSPAPRSPVPPRQIIDQLDSPIMKGKKHLSLSEDQPEDPTTSRTTHKAALDQISSAPRKSTRLIQQTQKTASESRKN